MIKNFCLIIFSVLAFVKAFPQQPEWIIKRPIDSAFFIGIAKTDKRNADYSAIARKHALQEISNEISVFIISKTAHSVSEVNRSLDEVFSSETYTVSTNQLEGYELFQKWENNDEYWVYYRLSKGKFYELQAQKRIEVSSAGCELLSLARKKLTDGKIEQALFFGFNALKSIEELYYERLTCKIDGQESCLKTEIIKFLRDLLAHIDIANTEQKITVKHSLPLAERVCFGLSYQNTTSGFDFSDIPFRFTISPGEGQIVMDSRSGKNSICTTIVSAPAGQGQQSVTITMNTGYYDSVFNFNSTGKRLISGLPNPGQETELLVSDPVIYISSAEHIYGILLSDRIIEPNIIEQLVESDFNVVTLKDDKAIDFYINIDGKAVKGDVFEGITTATASGTMEIVSAANNSTVFHQSYHNVSGGHLIEQKAGINALLNLKDSMIDDLKMFIVKQRDGSTRYPE